MFEHEDSEIPEGVNQCVEQAIVSCSTLLDNYLEYNEVVTNNEDLCVFGFASKEKNMGVLVLKGNHAEYILPALVMFLREQGL